ncbi:MAG: tRNA (cytidine(56)-2'-O)-methyltransferase [Nitrososphaerales archaeon]
MRGITVLRLGHRLHRDFRITTHCALVARALGASAMIIAGDRDDDIIKGIQRVNRAWGGDFQIEYRKEWRALINRWASRADALVILATMYGVNLLDVTKRLRKESAEKEILLIIGSEKMPAEVFHLADLNVAVSNQPHSEVAAVALILEKIFGSRTLKRSFEGRTYEVVPRSSGKQVKGVRDSDLRE